jgi:hypothetical protein
LQIVDLQSRQHLSSPDVLAFDDVDFLDRLGQVRRHRYLAIGRNDARDLDARRDRAVAHQDRIRLARRWAASGGDLLPPAPGFFRSPLNELNEECRYDYGALVARLMCCAAR